MQYMRAYNVFFEHPRWGMTLLSATACIFIPVVGPIVLIGYLIEVMEQALRTPERRYPAFDWGRFSEYLSRGVWPFLVQLVVGTVVAADIDESLFSDDPVVLRSSIPRVYHLGGPVFVVGGELTEVGR